jgi:hypothetical protein
LHAPADLAEQSADMVAMARDTKLAPDHSGNACAGPNLTTKTECFSAAFEKGW